MPHEAMRVKAFVGSAVVLGLVGCATPTPPLYQWDAFPRLQYSALLREGASPDEHIRALEAQAEKARASNAALPPGFRAHLGMLYLGAGNPQRARELWTAEKAAFPESAPYMDRLLKRLGRPAASGPAEENPA
jgi:hypothetical protein